MDKMNMPLLGWDFTLPADGWHLVVPKGEFPHAESGLHQVIDDVAVASIARRFASETAAPDFAGLLVDYDHFSQETGRPSEAAGWVIGLEGRADGVWARVRWTDRGEACVRGGRYRFFSPSWLAGECEMLGQGRVRPMRLDRLALTNDPNLRGIRPLTNRCGEPASRGIDAAEERKGNEHRRSMTKELLIELGLDAEATEQAVLAAVRALKNRAVELEETSARLLSGQVDADLEKHAKRIRPEAREKWRQALLANRAGAIELLESIIAPVSSAETPAGVVHQRVVAGMPVGSKWASAPPEAERQKIAVLAYKNRHGCSYDQAWQAVKAEHPHLFGERNIE
jgi:phage I-like protein